MKRWITEDKFGWIVVSVAGLMMSAQLIRFLIKVLWG